MRRNAKFGPVAHRASGGSRLRLSGLLADTSPRFWVFVAFVALVFLTGGASRYDVTSLIVLRPAAALFAAYALTVAGEGDFARIRVPLLLLFALALWMIVQLIPLPYGVWSALPGRAAIARMDIATGLGELWRPLTLSPARTMNSLGSLVVPIAGLMLYAVQSEPTRRGVLPILLIAASATALLGIAQFATRGEPSLYLYAVTNHGDPVGLFSNRNHNAVFLATTLLICAYLFSEWRRLERGSQSMAPIAMAAAGLLVVVTLLINGSRAGLLIGALAIGGAIGLYLISIEHRRHGQVLPHSKRHWLPGLIVVGVTLLAAVAFYNSAAFDRLATLKASDELRGQILPQVIQMARDHWVFGTGFGSFEYAYGPYEASQWLRSEYVNQAHNDALQWVIEGGLPAVVIALIFVLWLFRTALAHWRVREKHGPRTRMTVMALAVLLLLLLASVLDYPLRVPAMMLYAVLMVALIADPPEPKAREASRRDDGRGDARMRLR